MSTSVDDNLFLITNLKALLQEKLWLLEERLKSKRLTTPYHSLTNAHARILAALRGEKLTISALARRLEVSRQAAHKLVSHLIDEGYLVLEPIPNNAREKRIVFTRKGEDLKKAAAKALRELEKEVEKTIGKENFVALKALLAQNW